MDSPRAVIRVIAACVGLAGCAGDSAPADHGATPAGLWTEATAWRIGTEPLVTVRGGSADSVAGPLDPVGVVQLTDGRYVIGDGNQSGWDALLVFDSAGRFLEQWGRHGTGPGEFTQLHSRVEKLRGDTVAAYDSRDQGYEVFASDGAFVGQVVRPRARRGAFGSLFGLLDDRTQIRALWDPTARQPEHGREWRDSEIVAVDRSGEQIVLGRIVMPFWHGRDPNFNWQPFGIRAVRATGRRRVYYGTGEEFRVEVFDLNGKLHELSRPFDREPIGDAEQLLAESLAGVRSPDGSPPGSMAAYVANYDFPEFKAAFSGIIEDEEENVWVEHFRWARSNEVGPRPQPTIWSVFDHSGRFLGEVTVPARFMLSSVRIDRVLGIYQDSLGVKEVRAYPLVKPQPRM